MIPTLVVAYGNPMRGDDGVGPLAGETVDQWALPDVKVVIVQQLVPELIVAIKNAGRVLFIDAATAGIIDGAFASTVVEPAPRGGSLGHHETPAQLLGILRALEGSAPDAWMLSIAGESFEHGEQISAHARENLRAALAWIRGWLAESTCTKSA